MKKYIYEEIGIDIILIILFTALAFSLTYHPYFFGDELVSHRLAIRSNYSFAAIFQDLNSYKPRLLYNGIETLLAKWQTPRLVHMMLIAACMAWINTLLYGVVRYIFQSSRTIAWLLIATILTSRYGIMLYFDYCSGLIEMLSTALLLSAFLMSWLAWKENFKWRYAIIALIMAILCAFTHERYTVGILVAGITIAIAEYAGTLAQSRIPVIVWSLSLGFIPLALFFIANATLGHHPITMGTSAQQVTFGTDALWSAILYVHNVSLGGNFGHEWLWGGYNHLHPIGKIIGFTTAVFTAALIAVIAFKKELVWHNFWLGLSLVGIILALIAIASLTGSIHARFMFPVGILVTLLWIVMLKNTWQYIAVLLILATNMLYLLLGSHDSIANIYSSRAANSIASSLLNVKPNGKSGIVVGISDNSWIIGGGDAVDMGTRKGDTFSKVNLGDAIHIDPFIQGRTIDPKLYDFGLIFDGFGPHRTARYKLVSVDTALIVAGVLDTNKLPIKTILGNNEQWANWVWRMPPEKVDGAVILGPPGKDGWYGVLASDLNGRWLVYRARAKSGQQTPMRLQVNWHDKNGLFLSAMIEIVYPKPTWDSYSMLLKAPLEANIGYVYATLHDGAKGIVELQAVELK